MKTLLSLVGITLGSLAAVALDFFFRHLEQHIPGIIVVAGWVFALLITAFSVYIGGACLTMRNDAQFYMRPYFALLSLVLCALLLGYGCLSVVQAGPLHIMWYQAFGALMAQAGTGGLIAFLAYQTEVVLPFMMRRVDWQNEDSSSAAYWRGILFFDATLAVVTVSLQAAPVLWGGNS